MSERNDDLVVAVEAVRAASRVCRAVQREMIEPAKLEKRDKSPVTVADFASQAIVCAVLEQARPDDPLVGEEDAASLRKDAQSPLRALVVERVVAERGPADAERVLGWIDRGNDDASSERYWTLDPIDGTKGFLRGDQYAIALALIERGEVVLGVLGCPNLPLGERRGALFTARRGEPTRMQCLWDADAPVEEISVNQLARAADARLVESVESAHSDQSESARIAKALGLATDPFRIDSQCKYAAVARGDASIYLRLPTRKDYQEKIWDHAAGSIVVESAGGRVSDADGKPLDFTRGPTLARNRGVVATSGSIHDEVIAAVREVASGS